MQTVIVECGKSCLTNRNKTFEKLSILIESMNATVLNHLGIKLEKRTEYAIDYVIQLLENYKTATALDITKFVSGSGRRKSMEQCQYQQMQSYLERLKSYAKHIEVCGNERNSYSKTDHDATLVMYKNC